MIRILPSGRVYYPDDIFVTPCIKVEFGRVPSDLVAYPADGTIALGFVTADGSERVPVPEGIRVIGKAACGVPLPLEPWSRQVFLLLLDRAYAVWMDEELLFETQPAETEVHVPLTRAIASFSPALQRMLLGSE